LQNICHLGAPQNLVFWNSFLDRNKPISIFCHSVCTLFFQCRWSFSFFL
jgi:hypothetical protein